MAPQVVQYPRATSLTTHSSRTTGVEGAGGSGGHGRASRRRITTQHRRRRRCGGRRRVRRAQEGPGCGARGRRRGPAGLRANTPNHASAPQAPPVWRAPEGPEGTGVLRDRPLRAKLACGDLAGGRTRRCPEHQRSRKQQAQPRIPAAPPVWRAPEGPEGTGGLRDRPLRAKLACGDLAGGRARRRPEHQRRHKRHRKVRTPRSTPGSGRPGGRRGARAR